jgi:hypothetical protein
MRIIRDNRYVSEQKRRAKYAAIIGFLALAGTFPLAFIMQGNAGFVAVTYLFLLGGFVLFNRGMRGIGTWSHNARHAREDLALDSHLDDISDRYTMVHYGRADAGMVEHLLVGPGGVVVISTSDYPGIARVVDDRWQKGGPMLSRMFTFSGPQLGNPTREADKAFSLVEQALEGASVDVDIYTAIVFTASTADLDVQGASHPVMPVDELAGFIRAIPADSDFTQSDRDRVIALFTNEGMAQPEIKASTRRPVKVRKRAA